jgi:SAM-dependent methyltransferase
LHADGLQEIYKSDKYWRSPSPKTQGYTDYRADERLYLDTFRNRLRFVLRAGGPHAGRALDVGCAAGFCMAGMRELGFETHGLEISDVIGGHAREHFGFGDAVYIGTLESSPYPDNHFDLITMWDVVEHVPDPVALLRKAGALLKPDGLLVIETQDIDSRFARRLGPRWHHYKHEEHIYHFNPVTVRTLLGQAGFETTKLTHRLGGKYVSLHFIAERAARLHPALSKLLMPLARFERARVYLNFMDEMIVLARPS